MKPVLLDASCIVALLDVAEPSHVECLAIVTSLPPPLITCEAVMAESCHLLRHVHGANHAILEDVRKGVYQLPHVLSARAAEVARLVKKYADVPMDLADACLVDLATQMETEISAKLKGKVDRMISGGCAARNNKIRCCATFLDAEA